VECSDKVVDDCFEYITRRLEQLLVDSGSGVEAVRAVLAERGGDPAFAATTARELDAALKGDATVVGTAAVAEVKVAMTVGPGRYCPPHH
jgi:glycyl-tRNA synthetase